jgi:hypothetical protein
MNTTTVKEAKEQKIFVIDSSNGVEETNLYDFVMESAEETTSPVGVMNKLHIRHEDYSCRYGQLDSVNNDEGLFEVWMWGPSGHGSQFVDSFETEEAAEDFIFQRTYDYDFLSDDQRNTMYFDSYEEAMQDVIQLYAEENNIDIPVAESIMRHMRCADKIKEARKQKAIEAAKIKSERDSKLAAIYAETLTKIEGESYKETAKRLSDAIGQRIESGIFHKAVKIIRSK